MVILLNRKACGGKAGDKWERIASLVNNLIGEFTVIECDENAETNLERELTFGETKFIAAGGDGTVNYLLNIFVLKADLTKLKKIQIGAIGLGSSNDYHKPFVKEQSLQGIPARIDFNKSIHQDLGKIEWMNEEGAVNVSYWINNVSIGITAEANYLFNNPNKILAKLKKINTSIAILFAAIRTIFRYKNISLSIVSEDVNEKVVLSNLGIVKNPNFSGSFCYDSPYQKNGGQFYSHILYGLKKSNVLRMLYNLSKKRFMGLEGTRSFITSDLLVSSENFFALEFDGEVIRTKNAQFSLINNGVQLCA